MSAALLGAMLLSAAPLAAARPAWIGARSGDAVGDFEGAGARRALLDMSDDVDLRAGAPLGDWWDIFATNRGDMVEPGACSYSLAGRELPDFIGPQNHRMVGVPREQVYDNGARCGSCIEVSMPSGETYVGVVGDSSWPNQMPADQLDLVPSALERLHGSTANIEKRQGARARIVECDWGGPMQYAYQPGSSAHTVFINVWKHNLPLKRVTLDGVALARDFNNRWIQNVPWGNRLGQELSIELTGMGPQGEITVKDTLRLGEGPRLEKGTANFPINK